MWSGRGVCLHSIDVGCYLVVFPLASDSWVVFGRLAPLPAQGAKTTKTAQAEQGRGNEPNEMMTVIMRMQMRLKGNVDTNTFFT